MKEMVSDWKTFAQKWCKIAAHFYFFLIFFANFPLLARFFLVSVLIFPSVKKCFASDMTGDR